MCAVQAWDLLQAMQEEERERSSVGFPLLRQ